VRRVQRDIVQRASSLGPPQKRLKLQQKQHAEAPLEELNPNPNPNPNPNSHSNPTLPLPAIPTPNQAPLEEYVLNEVELHPGFYVDWDPDPDATIEPLAHAYGEHCCTLLADARARA
jgi:hypothetical protein